MNLEASRYLGLYLKHELLTYSFGVERFVDQYLMKYTWFEFFGEEEGDGYGYDEWCPNMTAHHGPNDHTIVMHPAGEFGMMTARRRMHIIIVECKFFRLWLRHYDKMSYGHTHFYESINQKMDSVWTVVGKHKPNPANPLATLADLKGVSGSHDDAMLAAHFAAGVKKYGSKP